MLSQTMSAEFSHARLNQRNNHFAFINASITGYAIHSQSLFLEKAFAARALFANPFGLFNKSPNLRAVVFYSIRRDPGIQYEVVKNGNDIEQDVVDDRPRKEEMDYRLIPFGIFNLTFDLLIIGNVFHDHYSLLLKFFLASLAATLAITSIGFGFRHKEILTDITPGGYEQWETTSTEIKEAISISGLELALPYIAALAILLPPFCSSPDIAGVVVPPRCAGVSPEIAG
jgi:hypothetical protein